MQSSLQEIQKILITSIEKTYLFFKEEGYSKYSKDSNIIQISGAHKIDEGGNVLFFKNDENLTIFFEAIESIIFAHNNDFQDSDLLSILDSNTKKNSQELENIFVEKLKTMFSEMKKGIAKIQTQDSAVENKQPSPPTPQCKKS